MKKPILILIVVFQFLLFFGCSSDNRIQEETDIKKIESTVSDNTSAHKTEGLENTTDDKYAVADADKEITPQDSTVLLNLAAENEKLALYVSKDTGLTGLLDKKTGRYYYSNPPDADNYLGLDPSNFDIAKSQLIVQAVDSLGNKIQLLSMPDSVANQGVMVEQQKDGVTCTYEFPSNKIKIPLSYSLKDNYLETSIDPSKVTEKGDFKVFSIKVLPYFGAIRGDEDGYLFIPDGSGAIFKANTTVSGSFYADIFGYEDVLEKDSVKSFQEKLLLPVFGIKNGDSGLLGIIDSAEAKCGIGAENAEEIQQLNNVYPVFNMRTLTSITLPSKNWVAKTVSVLEKHADFSVPFKTRYYPLEKEKNDYVDMALLYRSYLIGDKKITPLDNSLLSYDSYIDLYGYVKKQKSILGWPVDKDIRLTSLSQVRDIISDFSGKGLMLGIKYNGWIKDSFYEKIPVSAVPSNAVGNRDEMKKTILYAKEKGFTFFPSVDPITVYKGGNGFSYFRHAAKTVNNIAYTQYQYPVNTQYKSYEMPVSRLISPNALEEFTGRFMNSYEKLGNKAIAFDEIGNRVYSDYGSDPCSRNKAAGIIGDILWKYDEANEIMLTAAASYALGHAKHSVAAPYESSNYIICDRSVPFYQIALRGLINISSPAINLESEPGVLVLKCFETGMLPMFSFVAGNSEELKSSLLNRLYAADYREWKDYALKVTYDFSMYNKLIAGKKIIEHEQLQKGVFSTTYENGIQVIVNYSNKEYKDEAGQSVKPNGYKIIEE